jgi:hypothetical protein
MTRKQLAKETWDKIERFLTLTTADRAQCEEIIQRAIDKFSRSLEEQIEGLKEDLMGEDL